MPLTADLRDPASPVRGWFQARLPHVERLVRGWNAALQGVSTVRPVSPRERVDWATLGSAIQHRINFAFSAAPPLFAILGAEDLILDPGLRHRTARCFPTHAQLPPRRCGDLLVVGDNVVVALPPAGDDVDGVGVEPDMAGVEDFFARLAAFLHRHRVHGARLEPAVERRLGEACWSLALLEGHYRSGHDSWMPTSHEELTADYLLSLAPHYALADLAAVTELLYTCGLDQLHALGPIVANPPVFILGWADGDLVLGDCLVDIKATIRPHRLDPQWVYQLVAYVLLDAAGLYGIRRIGIYLARQGTLVSWALDDLIDRLARRPTSWQQLQANFCTLLGDLLPPFSDPPWITRPTPARK